METLLAFWFEAFKWGVGIGIAGSIIIGSLLLITGLVTGFLGWFFDQII